MNSPPKGRTVEEARAQADAKYRIRTAVHLRRIGLAMAVSGGYLLIRNRETERLIWGSVDIHLHGRPTLPLAWSAVVGLTLLVLGPLASATGYWLEARAVRIARSNPVTAQIFSQPKSFYD